MADHDREPGSALTLGLIGAAALAGCVPRVSAELVTTEAPAVRRPEPTQPRAPGPDQTPPRVVRAELAGDSIRIHFNEPVVIDGAIDPRDFRISFLRVHRDSAYAYAYAYYYDPGYIEYGTPMTLAGARFDGERLILESAPGLVSLCRQLDRDDYGYAGPGGEAGLFLHYAAGSIPIVDAAGNRLAEFGPDWVALGRTDPPEQRRSLNGVASLHAGTNLVQVACGPPIPPGPR
jgi:hypothetical protein